MMKKYILVVMLLICGGCCEKVLRPVSDSIPVIRFGVVADIQYADRDPVPQCNSYYRSSIEKLENCVSIMNEQDLDFVIQLGDFVDIGVRSYDKVLPIWSKLKSPTKSVIGNHDMEASGDYSVVLDKLGLEKPYYDFVIKNWRFIVLDTNEIGLLGSMQGTSRYEKAKNIMDSMKVLGYINALPWNSTVSDEQVAWLDQKLSDADKNSENVIVFGHHTIVSNAPSKDIWNSGRVIRCMQSHKSFKAYICGHNHNGSFAMIEDRYYLTMKGMLLTPDTNAFSVIELYPGIIKIDGYGRESDRELPTN